MLIDSHCHVLSSEYENVDQIIKKALSSGVNKLIINGYDIPSSKEAVRLANKYDEVFAAVGIGPENIGDYDNNSIFEIKKLLCFSKVIALGEIGLDYYWTKENKDKQILVFKNMLKLASKNSLPVIVHNRDATEDIYELLKEYNVTGIVHCFSGSIETAKRFVNLGFLIGIGGVITFSNSKKLKEVVVSIDIDNISLETDSPYLSPEPFRGKQNSPDKILLIAEKIASLKNITVDEVIAKTGNAVGSKFDL